METLISFLQTLNSLSPLAVIALLGTIIFIQVKRQPSADAVAEIKDNHLHELPDIAETLRRIEAALQRQEVKMGEEFSYIRARLNGVNKSNH